MIKVKFDPKKIQEDFDNLITKSKLKDSEVEALIKKNLQKKINKQKEEFYKNDELSQNPDILKKEIDKYIENLITDDPILSSCALNLDEKQALIKNIDNKLFWDSWESKSKELIQESISNWEKGEEIKFHSTHWGDLKDWLLENIFNSKCAYCETVLDRSTYHAEHFRPKGRISIRDLDSKKSKIVFVKDSQGQSIEHPGYFWLAYHWKNLLPSCEFCNTSGGKGIQFPSLKEHIFLNKCDENERQNLIPSSYYESKKYPGFFYLDPEDLNKIEEPLLLHPYFDDPSQYLVFGIRGTIAALDNNEKGLNSINVYNLRGEKIRLGRQETQEDAARKVSSFWNAISDRDNIQTEMEKETIEDIKKYKEGKAKYSAAAMAYIKTKFKKLMPLFEE